MLQCVAVCCSRLQCVAKWHSVSQRVVVSSERTQHMLQFGAACCSVWRCIAMRFSVAQCDVVWYSALPVVQCVAVCCSVLQCVAVHSGN